MKKAIDVKLNLKPLMGILVHTDFWEGPCRGGIREEMMPEAEMKTALSEFLNIMFSVAPASVGGAVPGDDFYYLPQ